MAIDEDALAVQSTSKSPYQLDLTQTIQACTVLVKHLVEEAKRLDAGNSKQNLLSSGADDSDEEDLDAGDQTPIWLILTTKKHIADKKRLKPGKIPLPHSLNTASNSTICLFTADPHSSYSDLLKHSSFPPALRTRITHVIGLKKLKTDYKSFESRRKLFAEHDIFLADDRISPLLPNVLGKVFFKGGVKRPVPVSIAAPKKGERESKEERQALAPRKDKESRGWDVVTPDVLSKEIERALGSALVHLAPSATTAVRIGRADFTPEMMVQNIHAVITRMAEKHIPKGWRNIKAIHIKGPNTMAFPIWLANELWLDEEDVKEKAELDSRLDGVNSISNDATSVKSKKRKAGDVNGKLEASVRHVMKKRKPEPNRKLVADMMARKENLKKQKAKVMADASNGIMLSS